MILQLLLTLALANTVYSANLVIHVNNLPEEAETLAVSTVLVDIQAGHTLRAISDRLVSTFINKYGGQWFSMISTTVFVSTIETEPHSVIWFSYDNVNVVLFKPSIQSEAELFYGARLSTHNISIVKSDMSEAIAQKMSITFANAAKNVSITLDIAFGPKWQCFIGQKGYDSFTQYANGSYLDFTVNDMQVVVFQTDIQVSNNTINTSIITDAVNAKQVVDTNNHLIIENVTAIVEMMRKAINDSKSQCTQQILIISAKPCYTVIANYAKSGLSAVYRISGWSVSVGESNQFSNSDNYLEITFGKLLFVINKLKL